jgi:hypothetical protein
MKKFGYFFHGLTIIKKSAKPIKSKEKKIISLCYKKAVNSEHSTIET